METSTWELPSLPLLRKPPSANPTLAEAGSARPASDPGEIGRTAAASPALPVPGDGGSKAKLRLVENERKPVTKPDHLLSLLRAAAPGRVRLAANMLYRGNDRARLARRAEIARQAGVPLIAVNDVLYHHPDRRELQDVLTCIREHLTIDRPAGGSPPMPSATSNPLPRWRGSSAMPRKRSRRHWRSIGR